MNTLYHYQLVISLSISRSRSRSRFLAPCQKLTKFQKAAEPEGGEKKPVLTNISLSRKYLIIYCHALEKPRIQDLGLS